MEGRPVDSLLDPRPPEARPRDRRRCRHVGRATALLLCACALPAQQLWRGWGVSAGLTEAYVSRIAMLDGDRAWIRHGAVTEMSIFDGYTVTHVAEPREHSQPLWESTTRVYGSPLSGLWTATDGALRQFQDGAWKIHFRMEQRHEHADSIPLGKGVIVLTENHLRLFDPATQTFERIRVARETAPRVVLGDGAQRARDP